VLTLVDSVTRVGGGERLAVEIATRLDPAEFQASLCATRTTSEEAVAAARVAGVPVHSLGRTTTISPRAWLRLFRLLRSERFDVLHAHKFGSNVWGALIGTLARVPVVVAHEHTWSYEGQRFRKLLDRHVVGRLADAFVAVSQADARRMVAIERVESSKVRVIPNGIAPLSRPRADVRAELGIPADAPVIGTVSVLRAQKALDLLLDATDWVRREVPQVRVLIAGDGPLRPALEAQAASLGLGNVVDFLGVRSDVADVLSALDVAVLSSDYEGSPLAVLEYMAAGKAVVATRVGGLPEMITHGSEGLLVEPRDAAGLSDAIVSLLRDENRRRAMGAAAHERQRTEFDIELTVSRIEGLYVELLHGRRPRG
jgi:glycosyltransferase involved in cell wall biosynthesis